MNQIWGTKRRRSVWKRRGLAILFVLIFVGPALFLASFAGSTIAHQGSLAASLSSRKSRTLAQLVKTVVAMRASVAWQKNRGLRVVGVFLGGLLGGFRVARREG